MPIELRCPRRASSTSTTAWSATSLRVHDERRARPPPFRGAAGGRSLARLPHDAGRSPGFANRVGDPVPLEYPTTGSGDYRIPALTVELADGSTVLELVYLEPPDRRRQARPGAPTTDCPRPTSRPTTRPTRSRSRSSTRLSGLRVDLTYTIFADRPVIARSARIRNERRGHGPAHRRDERDARPARRPLGAASSSAAPGRARTTSSPRRLRPGRQSVGSDRGASSANHNPFIALRRATTTEDDGEVYALSLVYSGNFIAEAEVDPFEHDPRPDRDQPEHVHLDARAGRRVRDPGGGPRLLRRRARRDERRAPRPVPRAAGPRDLARRAAAGPHQQLGGDLLRLRRGEAARDRDGRARPRRRAVRPRRRLVRRARLGRHLARRLGRRPAQAPERARRARRQGRGPRPQVRAVDRARDGQPAEPAVRGAPGLGDRRARPAADREPPAARPRHVAARGRRPPLRGPVGRPRRARRSRTSSGT